MLPLSRIRSFADWKDEVLDLLQETTEDIRKLRSQLNELERDYVKPVEMYQFPVTTLSSTTPAEAVCTIFETLNRTGVKLSVFELITARAFAREVRLRDMWAEACRQYPIIEDFAVDPYYVLQGIAVVVRGSPKRSVVLALDVDEIVEHWDSVVRGVAEVLTLLRDECGVLVSKWLPYQTIVVTMAAAWSPIAKAVGPAVGARRMKMARWFWSSVFMGTYENSPNSTTERDVPELVEWFEGGSEPTAVATFSFDPERWRDVTPRQRALYRATIALLMRHSPMEFHEGMRLSKPIIDGKAVDDHHVFPRAFLAGTGRKGVIDSVLNHTLIDRITNIRIGGRAPSDYLKEMRGELKSRLPEILDSHGLPSDDEGPLFTDRFEDFLQWRLGHLTKELSEMTGAAPDERGVLRSPVWPGTEIEAAEAPSRVNIMGGLPEDVQEFLRARARDEATQA
jgi:hypothetical protein